MGSNDRFVKKRIKEKVAQVECPSKLLVKVIFPMPFDCRQK